MAYALVMVSALAASLIGIFAKLGSNKNVDSILSTALKISVMLVLSFVCMLFTDGLKFSGLTTNSWILIIGSGIACVFAWGCFFKAIEIGDTLKVIAIDKFSVVFILLFSVLFFGDTFTVFSGLGVGLILLGLAVFSVRAFLKPKKTLGELGDATDFVKEDKPKYKPIYLILAFVSAFAVALLTLFAKMGMDEVDTNTATFLRTAVALVFLWGIVFVTRKQKDAKKLSGKEWVYVLLSGLMTGIGWLTYFAALRLANSSIIAALDKVSIVFAMIWSALILKEKPDLFTISGCVLIAAGAVFLAL